MPVFSRRGLRQVLGTNYVRDVLTGQNESSIGGGIGSMHVLDQYKADVSLSGLGLFQGAYLYINDLAYRVASFNTASGAWVSLQRTQAAVPQGTQYELHWLLSPTEKDRCLNETIRHLRFRRETTIAVVDGAEFYDIAVLGPGADVLDVYAFANPTGSLSRDRRPVTWWQQKAAGWGTEIRIEPALWGSWRLVVDAILDASLGAGAEATIDIPDEGWLLAGAAARAADMLKRRIPTDEATARQRGSQPPPEFTPPTPAYWASQQREWAREFSRLSALFAPRRDLRPQLDEPW